MSVEIRQRLAQGEVGEVQLVRADLGAPLTHIPRLAERDLGGGAVLDLGVYCLQFVLMVFNGEKPESVQASGFNLDTGINQATKCTSLPLTDHSNSVVALQLTLMHCGNQINKIKVAFQIYGKTETFVLVIICYNIQNQSETCCF